MERAFCLSAHVARGATYICTILAHAPRHRLIYCTFYIYLAPSMGLRMTLRVDWHREDQTAS